MSWIDDQRPDDAMAGAFEAIGPEPVVTIAASLFRDAMCRLGAAVHVVTTAGPAGSGIVSSGNVSQFFGQLLTWYGNNPDQTAPPANVRP